MILSLTSFDFAHSKAVLPHTGKHSTHRELQLEFDIDTNRTKGLTEMLDDLPFQKNFDCRSTHRDWHDAIKDAIKKLFLVGDLN